MFNGVTPRYSQSREMAGKLTGINPFGMASIFQMGSLQFFRIKDQNNPKITKKWVKSGMSMLSTYLVNL